MRVHKTWQNQRKTYTYVSLKGEKTVLRPGEDGVTEVLNGLGEKLGMEIRMQRSEIFDAMHRL